MPNFPTLAKLADDLESGRTTSRKLVEACIAKIADPAGEGQRAFIHVDKDAALATADAMDALAQGQGCAVALCRYPHLDQGSVRHQGPGDARRLPRARRFPAGRAGCRHRGAAAQGRLCRDRAHQHDRVRLFRHRHQSALRYAEGRLEPGRGPRARRLVLGRRGLRARRHGAWRARHRYRRLLPHSGGL